MQNERDEVGYGARELAGPLPLPNGRQNIDTEIHVLRVSP